MRREIARARMSAEDIPQFQPLSCQPLSTGHRENMDEEAERNRNADTSIDMDMQEADEEGERGGGRVNE